jgi:hypothetical protein
MARNVSKNARREGAHDLTSKYGGKIIMRTVYQNGKMKHFAECEKTGKTARRPRDLM